MGRTLRVLVAAAGVLVVFAATPAARAAGDTTPPSTPQNVHFTGATETTLTVAWSPSTDNVGVNHYRVYRDGFVVGTKPQSSSPSYTDSGLWPHSTHSYYIDAVDAAGNASPTSTLITGNTNNDLTPPTAPTNLTPTFDKVNVDVALTWGASTDNVGVDHYDIFRNLVKIGTRPATSLTFTDTTLSANTTVKYLVEGVDFFGNPSPSSNQPVVITDIQPPTAPTGLHITATTSTTIALAWTASTDNFSVQSYDVYRNGTKVATQSSATGPTFFMAGLTPGTTYSFFLKANDPNGNTSAASNTATGSTTGSGDTTPPTTPANLAATTAKKQEIALKWDPSTDNAGPVNYRVNRNGSLLATTNAAGFTDVAAPTNTTLAYTVSATDVAGNVSPTSNQANAYVDTMAPSTPNTLQGADAGGSVNLQWAASNDNVGVTSYVVARGGLTVGTTTGLSYADTTAAEAKTYTYTVTALDAAGNDSVAASKSVTTSVPSGNAPAWPGGFLSDMTPTSSTGSIHKDRTANSHVLKLNGTYYAKGLGSMAPSSVSYALGGTCKTFSTGMGISDEVDQNGSVQFQVWADGTMLFESNTMTGKTSTKTINLNVNGHNTLTLKTLDVGSGSANDSAVWALPRLTCTTSLSDMNWTSATNGNGPVMRDKSHDNHALKIDGVTYAKGLGTAAPSTVEYQLNGACSKFKATVGVDDEEGNGGSATFQLWLDGTQVWNSGTMTGAMGAKAVTRQLTGVQKLELRVVHVGGGPTNESADWADARVICTG